MATRKVARSFRRVETPADVVEVEKQAGEIVARVREKAGGTFIAVVRGPETFAQGVAAAFAEEWSRERRRSLAAVARHKAEIERLEQRWVAKASRAAEKAARELGGAS
jgi:hypothetical protein